MTASGWSRETLERENYENLLLDLYRDARIIIFCPFPLVLFQQFFCFHRRLLPKDKID